MTRMPLTARAATCACARGAASLGTSPRAPANPSRWGRRASRSPRARGRPAGRTTAGARPSRVLGLPLLLCLQAHVVEAGRVADLAATRWRRLPVAAHQEPAGGRRACGGGEPAGRAPGPRRAPRAQPAAPAGRHAPWRAGLAGARRVAARPAPKRVARPRGGGAAQPASPPPRRQALPGEAFGVPMAVRCRARHHHHHHHTLAWVAGGGQMGQRQGAASQGARRGLAPRWASAGQGRASRGRVGRRSWPPRRPRRAAGAGQGSPAARL
jgi:hypothetical protein